MLVSSDLHSDLQHICGISNGTRNHACSDGTKDIGEYVFNLMSSVCSNVFLQGVVSAKFNCAICCLAKDGWCNAANIDTGCNCKHILCRSYNKNTTYPAYNARKPSCLEISHRAWVMPRYRSSACRLFLWPCTWSLVFVVSIGKVPTMLRRISEHKKGVCQRTFSTEQ